MGKRNNHLCLSVSVITRGPVHGPTSTLRHERVIKRVRAPSRVISNITNCARPPIRPATTGAAFYTFPWRKSADTSTILKNNICPGALACSIESRGGRASVSIGRKITAVQSGNRGRGANGDFAGGTFRDTIDRNKVFYLSTVRLDQRIRPKNRGTRGNLWRMECRAAESSIDVRELSDISLDGGSSCPLADI